ncbi:glycosyltransferase [Candidatus Marinamargulisbacteria bacterium SCGC AG-343-D04]|nr:glycosyltransferase [Candidatus Marinamargulisbacteria bacterium SCGC AG-343-D04]
MKKTLEIIIPIYNEIECLDELMTQLLALRPKVSENISFLFVNDGSVDGSGDVLNQYVGQHSLMKVIHLSRNFGHQFALTAGFDHSDGDYVGVIDADLQDPPEIMLEMLSLMKKESLDIVYAQRIERKGESVFKKCTAHLFYSMIRKFTKIDIPENTGDCRLINKKTLLAFKTLRERHRFIRGLIPWIGFKSKAFQFSRDERYAGQTKYPFFKMLELSMDAMFSFSRAPLKIANVIGFLSVLCGFVLAIYTLLAHFLWKVTVPGYTTIILVILILSGIQLLILGILGEYIGRIFEESKHRPLYIVDVIHDSTLSE